MVHVTDCVRFPNMDIMEDKEGMLAKMSHLMCCPQLCRDICACCFEAGLPEPEVREIKHIHVRSSIKHIHKDDIQPVVNTHQPVGRLDSAASDRSASGASSASYYSTPQPSPAASSSTAPHPATSPGYRERMDSVDHWSLPSRTGSTSGSASRHGSSSSRKGSSSSDSYPLAGSRRATPTPVIDMKPIEFWAATNRETVQPRTPKRRLPSESEISVEDFKPHLYECANLEESDESLTDEQKLARFKLGQVHFSFQYDIPNKCLLVRIIEARDLPRPFANDSNRQDMAHSNPYAKVCILPDKKASQQTGVQKKTQNPEWNDTFRFEVPFKDLESRVVEILVKDFDKYSRHCIIGQVHMSLESVNLVKGCHMWKPIMPCENDHSDLGEVLLSLNYLPSAGRLNVDVIKARQLLQTDLISGSDPFVKLVLCQGDKVIKSKKTSVKKNTIDPVFNESLSFNVTPDQLEQSTLVVTVYDRNAKSRDDFVGRYILGRQATGHTELTHWNRMLQCHRSPVAQWHTLRSKEECDKKSPISAHVY